MPKKSFDIQNGIYLYAFSHVISFRQVFICDVLPLIVRLASSPVTMWLLFTGSSHPQSVIVEQLFSRFPLVLDSSTAVK